MKRIGRLPILEPGINALNIRVTTKTLVEVLENSSTYVVTTIRIHGYDCWHTGMATSQIIPLAKVCSSQPQPQWFRIIQDPGMGAMIDSATNDLRTIIGELMRHYGKSTLKEKTIVDNKQKKHGI